MSATSSSPSNRISPLQRGIEERVANPLFRWLLRTRLHWLASRWLVLLSYVGPRTGRRYTTPVAYARSEGNVVVVTPNRESNWWRNFTEPRACRLWLRGTARTATGVVVTGTERERLLAAYVDSHGLLGRSLGADGRATPEELARTNRTLTVVRFTLEDE
jgi:deazaflavin-dependent oxidoreductase (nitroreductase family)